MRRMLLICLLFVTIFQSCKKEDLAPKSLYYKSGIWNIDKLSITDPLAADSLLNVDDAGFFIFYNMIINDEKEHYLGQKVVTLNGVEQKEGLWWSINGDKVTVGPDAYNTTNSKTYKVEMIDRSHHIWTFDSIYPDNKHYKEILHLSELEY